VSAHYQRPGWFSRSVFNPLVATLTRLGLGFHGLRILEVPGRRTGALRRTPVNLLQVGGARYLVAPRGQTQWVRNLRASGRGVLRVGRRRDSFTASELGDDEKAPILRAYLARWKWRVGGFFEGTGPDSSDDELRRIAPNHPVFRLGRKAP